MFKPKMNFIIFANQNLSGMGESLTFFGLVAAMAGFVIKGITEKGFAPANEEGECFVEEFYKEVNKSSESKKKEK